MGSKYLVFRNYYFPLLNGYSIYGLCLTFWTNEFLGSYSNYKFIISFSIFNRMGFWRILCSQSNIEEVFYLSFSTPIYPLRNSTNNKIPFFPFIFQKDFFGFILILCLYLLQTHFGISSFSHTDNALELCGLLTPLHIVPEWYFLCQYAPSFSFILCCSSFSLCSFFRSCNYYLLWNNLQWRKDCWL